METSAEVLRLEAALKDFKSTSQEIERELEAQIAEYEEQNRVMKRELANASPTIEKLREKIQQLESSLIEERNRQTHQVTGLREHLTILEQENESLERQARVAQSSISKLEQDNADLLERLAFAETESPELSPTPAPTDPTTPQRLPRRRNREHGETPHGKRVHSN